MLCFLWIFLLILMENDIKIYSALWFSSITSFRLRAPSELFWQQTIKLNKTSRDHKSPFLLHKINSHYSKILFWSRIGPKNAWDVVNRLYRQIWSPNCTTTHASSKNHFPTSASFSKIIIYILFMQTKVVYNNLHGHQNCFCDWCSPSFQSSSLYTKVNLTCVS